MSKKISKVNLTCALDEPRVSYLPNKTVCKMLESEEYPSTQEDSAIQEDAEGVSTTATENQSEDLGATIAALKKKKKIAILQQEVKALEDSAASLQRFSISDIESIVPKFSGDDAYSIEKWFYDFDNATNMSQCTDHFKYMCMRRLLTGTAAVFLRTSFATDYSELSDALFKQFKRQFTVKEVKEQLAKRHRRSGENIISYMLTMKEIALQGDIEEIELVRAIITGLRDRTSFSAILYAARDLDELQDLLLTYEKKVNDCNKRTRPPASKTRCINGSQDELEDGKPSTSQVNAVFSHEEDAYLQRVELSEYVRLVFINRGVKHDPPLIYRAVIDSGSPASFICKSLLPSVLKYLPVGSSYSGLNGDNIETFGVVQTEITLFNKCKEVSLVVVKSPVFVLLGRDFLETFNISFYINM